MSEGNLRLTTGNKEKSDKKVKLFSISVWLLRLSQSHLSQSHWKLLKMVLNVGGKKKQQHFTGSIRIFKKLMTKYSHKKCTKTFQIWKNKNVNKTQCFYSETVPFRKNNFWNGMKLLPKRVNKQLRPNIQILCLTYSCKVVPAAPENTS